MLIIIVWLLYKQLIIKTTLALTHTLTHLYFIIIVTPKMIDMSYLLGGKLPVRPIPNITSK